MSQEPHMPYKKAHRQTMTSYLPPMRQMRRRDYADKQTSLGWWELLLEFAGYTLMDYLASPVAGVAALVVSFCLAVFGAVFDLFSYGVSALTRKVRKTQT